MTPEELAEAESRRKDRELDLKEREVAAKEREADASRWLNPVVIGIFAAALGLIGNIFVVRENNKNTQDVEHLHLQSNLIVEAIRTNGNTSEACKNLVFFLNLGFLDDPNKTIRGACPSNPSGPPTLPTLGASGLPAGDFLPQLFITVKDADTHMPIDHAKIEISGDLRSPHYTAQDGTFAIHISGEVARSIFNEHTTITVSKDGYVSKTIAYANGPLHDVTLKRARTKP